MGKVRSFLGFFVLFSALFFASNSFAAYKEVTATCNATGATNLDTITCQTATDAYENYYEGEVLLCECGDDDGSNMEPVMCTSDGTNTHWESQGCQTISCESGEFFADGKCYDCNESVEDVDPFTSFTSDYGSVGIESCYVTQDDTIYESAIGTYRLRGSCYYSGSFSAPLSPEYSFSMKLSPEVSGIKSITLNASGTFYIDWGDGTSETYTSATVTNRTLTHQYTQTDPEGGYIIKIGGRATGYGSERDDSAPTFKMTVFGNLADDVVEIDGSLGRVFPTLNNGYAFTDQPVFAHAFEGMAKLNDTIPPYLFAGIHGRPRHYMFADTFKDTTGFYGEIPAGLFGQLSNTILPRAFRGTFSGCTGLTGEIPRGLFGDYTTYDNGSSDMFSQVFMNCSGLTGPAAMAPNGQFLHDIIPHKMYGSNAYTGATNIENWAWIPTSWGGGGERAYPFEITVEDATDFTFYISAAGEFWVDCGDGSDQQEFDIDRTGDTYTSDYSCSWSEYGTHTIRFGGKATEYNTDGSFCGNYFCDGANEPAIRFDPYSGGYLSEIRGSLGRIFPTIGDGKDDGEQPVFVETFADHSYLTGSIPEDLFAGIYGAPVSHMFGYTFSGSSGLTGSIPGNLFGGIKGAPAYGMFYSTFAYCSGLTGSIPGNLFSGIKGAPATDMFASTFEGCTGLTGEIPANLFSGIKGRPIMEMFALTFYNCTGLTGIGGPLFAGISGAPAVNMFSMTFDGCTGLTGEIPENMFGNLYGGAQSQMFYQTFGRCDALTGPSAKTKGEYLYNIWPNENTRMYNGATGLSDYDMIPSRWGGGGQSYIYPFELTTTKITTSTTFTIQIGAAGTFYVDWGDGSAVQTITGTTTATAYSHTFAARTEPYTIRIGGMATSYSTSTTTPAIRFTTPTLIGGISGSLGRIFPTIGTTQPRFYYTFYGATNMTGTIPENLFVGISGAPVSYMFYYTFYNCSGLTGEIPANLFSGIKGAPAQNMFLGTFAYCSGLTDEIPADLFIGIKGAPAVYMFNRTFANCTGLTGIGGPLFKNISGAPARDMYCGLFEYCSGLQGNIPAGLFGNIYGNGAYEMYDSTFRGCSGLTGEIPMGLFGNISNQTGSYYFWNCFNNCVGLNGPAARNADGRFFHDMWPNNEVSSTGAYTGATNIDDWDYIPSSWGGGGMTRSYPFELTTTSNTTEFQFEISAAGTFHIDCGSDSNEGEYTIERSYADYPDSYGCSWDNAGAHTIRLGGRATEYNTNYDYCDNDTCESSHYPAISFAYNSYLSKISGSLGAIFPTIGTGTGDGEQPSFIDTFYNCTNLTGQIPEDLFTGVHGQPLPYMFYKTFYECQGLTGEIPANLFIGISGQPAEYMFYYTFQNCTGLTGIGGPLFKNISGYPVRDMFCGTFHSCSGLRGSIPAGLFGNIAGDGAYEMYDSVFSDCSGLTGEIPKGLFGNISTVVNDNYFFWHSFYGCSGLTGPAARNADGRFLHEMFDQYDCEDYALGSSAYDGAENIDDWANIPEYWGGGGGNRSYPFELTTTKITTSTTFTIQIGAAGTFYVDWGDGSAVQTITGTTTATSYSHTFAARTEPYTIRIGGKATSYSTSSSTPAIRFTTPSYIGGISGSLGRIFPTIGTTQPRFYYTFANAYNMTGEIPADLFVGISGAPVSYMFYYTFYSCNNLTGSIPENLFAGISGAPATAMFYSTFEYCRRLTGEIPENLFRGISGPAANYMFKNTFYNCSGLTGIGGALFAGISGPAANYMFENTFYYCTGLTGSIPAGLFGTPSGTHAASMFSGTFYGCSGLTGAIPSRLFGSTSGVPATRMFYSTFYGCSGLTGTIPSYLFGSFSGSVSSTSSYAFQRTFYNCSGLVGAIPAGLFGGSTLTGSPASYMFYETFHNCYGLTSIPSGLFAGFSASGTLANYAFYSTFYNCFNLTGPSGRNASGTYLYNIWPSATTTQVNDMYYNCTGLSDYSSIPTNWK